MAKKHYFTILFSIFAFFSTFGQCIPPSALTATNITETTAVLNWNSVNAVSSEVIILPANFGEPSQNEPGMAITSSPFVVTGLTPCTTYKFYVRSVCNAGTASSFIGPSYFATNSPTGCPPIAQNDSFIVFPTNGSIVTSDVSVLANDYIVGMPANTSNVIVTPLSISSGFSLNPNGTINVLPGTAPGTYALTYTICNLQNQASCSTGTAIIIVANEGLFLKAFVDTNNNGTQDSGETNFNFGQFHYQINNNGITNSVSSSDGMYYIQESNPANLYNLSYTIDSNYSSYYTVSPSFYNDISFASGSGVVVYNFPITQLPYLDASVNVIPFGAPPRPGFTYQNRIAYQNLGNLTIASGIVTFNKSNAVSITAVSESGITTTATGFTYGFTNLLPNETRYIYVTMQVPTIPTVSLGDLLTNTASITIPAGDINISNNSSSLTQTIVGSYDPNDKTESHGEKILHSSFTSNDYLTYTIQFENTGTFYAVNVKITDVLDAKLDETSVKMINASHSNILTRFGNTLNWNMNGIDLLPSGKGHVTFQIKPKPGFVIGDIIPNTASIFFDFNPAIITNTFQTEFVNTLSISEFENVTYSVYPNPTNSFVMISGNDNLQVIESVVITDISGKTIQTKTINMVTAKIDLSDLSNGIYFAKVKSGNSLSVVKIIKK